MPSLWVSDLENKNIFKTFYLFYFCLVLVLLFLNLKNQRQILKLGENIQSLGKNLKKGNQICKNKKKSKSVKDILGFLKGNVKKKIKNK